MATTAEAALAIDAAKDSFEVAKDSLAEMELDYHCL
jgi:hypothetical protein